MSHPTQNGVAAAAPGASAGGDAYPPTSAASAAAAAAAGSGVGLTGGLSGVSPPLLPPPSALVRVYGWCGGEGWCECVLGVWLRHVCSVSFPFDLESLAFYFVPIFMIQFERDANNQASSLCASPCRQCLSFCSQCLTFVDSAYHFL